MAITIDTNFWISLFGTLFVCGFAGFTFGSIIVYYLTTNVRSKEKNAIFLSIATLALAIVVNALFWISPWQILWNTGIFIVAIFVGYFWAVRGILKLEFEAPLPEAIPVQAEDKKAVIVLARGEAEDYMPLPMIKKFRKKDETNVPQSPKWKRVFDLYQLKRKYDKISKYQETIDAEAIKENKPKSPYKKIYHKILENLEKSFLKVDIYQEAFVNDWPFLNQALIKAIAQGAEEITIFNLFLSENYYYTQAIDTMKKIDYSELGVDINQTDFLADSERIQTFVAEKIHEALPKEKVTNTIGVLLIAEGQPEQWDDLYKQTQPENQFREGIKEQLIELGFKEDLIEFAWIHDDREPTIKQGLQALAEKGCNAIIHVASTIPIDCLSSLVEIPAKVEKVNLPDVEFIEVNAWNFDEELIKVYLNQLTETKELPLKDLASESAIVIRTTALDEEEKPKEENDLKEDISEEESKEED